MLSNIILIGFMGSGKTTIGREVARLYESVLLDTDQMIETNCNLSISEIFAQNGEEYFRECERNLCKFIKDNIRNAVIATGGGLPMRYDARELGSVFYLQAPIDILIERIKNDASNVRPLFSNIDVVRDLYEKRIETYETQSDYTLDARDDAMTIAKRIYSYVKGY